MRFITNSKYLLKNLQRVHKIISKNTVLACLEMFHFEIKGSSAFVTASDLETYGTVEMHLVEKEGEGSACVQASILLKLLKELPEQPLTLTFDLTKLELEISTGTDKFIINLLDRGEYPKLPDVKPVASIEIATDAFKKHISEVYFATSQDTLRPAMTGVYFHSVDGKLTLVATDAHMLVMRTLADIELQSGVFGILSYRSLDLILKAILPKNQMNIAFGDTFMKIESPGITLLCRKIEAKYPDYPAVIPADSDAKLKVDRGDLLAAAKRAKVFAHRSTHQCIFQLSATKMELDANDLDFGFKSKQCLPCNYSGSVTQVAFNASILIDLLNHTQAGEIDMQITDARKGVLIRPADEDPAVCTKMLLMPLMIGM